MHHFRLRNETVVNQADCLQQMLCSHTATPSFSKKRRSFVLVRIRFDFTLLSLAPNLLAI